MARVCLIPEAILLKPYYPVQDSHLLVAIGGFPNATFDDQLKHFAKGGLVPEKI